MTLWMVLNDPDRDPLPRTKDPEYCQHLDWCAWNRHEALNGPWFCNHCGLTLYFVMRKDIDHVGMDNIRGRDDNSDRH